MLKSAFSRFPRPLSLPSRARGKFNKLLEHALQLEEDLDLAERVEVFVGRFGHLQDTVDSLRPGVLVSSYTKKTNF